MCVSVGNYAFMAHTKEKRPVGYYTRINESHLGRCKYCWETVYWVWDEDGRPHWAPPFEAWILGVVPQELWVHHYHRCR